jgi:hypothetical protein
MPNLYAGIIAGWIRVGRNSNAALPANGILWKGRQQKGLDGLDRCPGSFFCGTVVPAIAASNPHIHFRHFAEQNQWRERFKNFSTRVLVPGKP